ncbi:hypothetical protein KY084_09730 [Stakelama sp. CBK3Z-3]|uniref:Uncharacterized protein n=1 Tax=Stakelama flava TaxID=2860338 RepID=A0ABS6XLR0_9SPHN|nr:hypothetical protein [Stakelama flava]MBW4331149.1 hypothetical protein [Stakelama flava]
MQRSGFAIATGGALVGLIVAALVANGGKGALGALFLAWLAGTLMGMIAIAACAGPVWLILHRIGARGPVAAAITGAGIVFFLFLAAQTRGFGLLGTPSDDTQTLVYRWISALATSLILAGIAATIALAMWRVAYRRSD